MPGLPLIINAFLRWAETARAGDRAQAAHALARAYSRSRIAPDDRNAAEMAMIFLLDDPAPRVRLALAEALADFDATPRAIILPLAEDQPEIAAQVILRSPVLTDMDLVDLAAKGSETTRCLVAHRTYVSRIVSAALAEIGGQAEISALLENEGAMISRGSLKRIAERLGGDADIRHLLLERPDLSSDKRQHLVEQVGAALADFDFVRAAIGERRVERIAREACDVATIAMVGEADGAELEQLVDHLRVTGRLTPAFLMHALCSGKIAFFAAAIVNLSGQAERRVRSILADGRQAAVRALFEDAGLGRDVSDLFSEATLLWRREAKAGSNTTSVATHLIGRTRAAGAASAEALLDLVEALSIAERRQTARSFAQIATQEAA